MSVQALTWALKQKAGSATLKAVLIAVANYADERGRCWPSQGRLASDTEMTERSIRTALKTLEARGFLVRKARWADGNRKADVIQLLYRKNLPVPGEEMGQAENASGTQPENDDTSTGKSRQFIPEGVSGEPSIEPSLEEPSDVTRAKRASHTDFPPNAFDVWYDGYPHKVGRQAAERVFERVRRSGKATFAQLIAGRDAYVANKRIDVEWCNPATWLTQGRWDDAPAVVVPFRKPHVGVSNDQVGRKSDLASAFDRLDERLDALGGS